MLWRKIGQVAHANLFGRGVPVVPREFAKFHVASGIKINSGTGGSAEKFQVFG
jgi:hypothetical protein